MPDTLTDLGLVPGATYSYPHLMETPRAVLLTDGTTAYSAVMQEDGHTVITKVEDEHWFPISIWKDRRESPPSLRITRQGPYYQSTWDITVGGVATLEPRTSQYPDKLSTGLYTADVLNAMSSARRLKAARGSKEDNVTTDAQAKRIDEMAVPMTHQGLRAIGFEPSKMQSFLQGLHELFTLPADRISSTKSQQRSSGDTSGTEQYVPGEELEEED